MSQLPQTRSADEEYMYWQWRSFFDDAAISMKRLTQPELAGIRTTFAKLDTNQNGFLSFDEILQGYMNEFKFPKGGIGRLTASLQMAFAAMNIPRTASMGFDEGAKLLMAWSACFCDECFLPLQPHTGWYDCMGCNYAICKRCHAMDRHVTSVSHGCQTHTFRETSMQVCAACQLPHLTLKTGYIHNDLLHMQKYPDGRYLCEFCAVWRCKDCCKLQFVAANQMEAAKPGLCFVRDWHCAAGCQKLQNGGWFTDPKGVEQTAMSNLRPHCATCRMRVLGGGLLPQQGGATTSQHGNALQNAEAEAKSAMEQSNRLARLKLQVDMNREMNEIIASGISGPRRYY